MSQTNANLGETETMDINQRIVVRSFIHGEQHRLRDDCAVGKQLAGVIDAVEKSDAIYHIPANKEDEAWACVQARSWATKRPMEVIMQNTAIGVTINTGNANTVRMPLPMLISYRGELGEPVACQVEMAVHTKALLAQLNIPTYHFHKQSDVEEVIRS